MEGISNTIQSSGVSLFSIIKAKNGSGRINVPVSASSPVILGLKHISTIPVPGNSGMGGFSVSKLRALDNMIDMLTRAGKLDIKPDTKNLDSGTIDELLKGYTGKLKDIISSNTPYRLVAEAKGIFINGLV